MENSNLFNENSLLNENGKADLYEAAKWAKFLGIIGLIFIGLMIIVGIFASSIISTSVSQTYGNRMPLGSGFFMVMYILLAALYFYPTWTLFKFGNLLRVAVRQNNAPMFNEALSNLKSCFKFMGVLTLIIIGLYILAIVFASLGAAIM